MREGKKGRKEGRRSTRTNRQSSQRRTTTERPTAPFWGLPRLLHSSPRALAPAGRAVGAGSQPNGQLPLFGACLGSPLLSKSTRNSRQSSRRRTTTERPTAPFWGLPRLSSPSSSSSSSPFYERRRRALAPAGRAAAAGLQPNGRLPLFGACLGSPLLMMMTMTRRLTAAVRTLLPHSFGRCL